MNKPNFFRKTYKKIHTLRTRKAFAEAIRAYNAQVPEREKGKRGLDPNKINFAHQVEEIVGYFCANANKIVNGVYKFTRSHASKYLGVSEPTIDRYLRAAMGLQWITMKDIGLCTFAGHEKAINCIYCALDVNKFQYEEVEIVDKSPKTPKTKKTKNPEFQNFDDTIKDFQGISPFL